MLRVKIKSKLEKYNKKIGYIICLSNKGYYNVIVSNGKKRMLGQFYKEELEKVLLKLE